MCTPLTHAQASKVYVTQNGNPAGNCTGSPLLSPAGFNNGANWGSGENQIGPGTTVLLCGTFTGTPGQQLLSFQGSGTAAKPITLLFDTNTILTASYWAASGAIATNGHTNITIDGGTNGIIQNTLNGTSGGPCSAGPCSSQQQSRLVYLTGCTYCTVQNLSLLNAYVNVPGPDSIDQTTVNAIIYLQTDNVTINNVTAHDCGWCINGWGNNLVVEYSNIYNMDHGVAFGANSAVSNIRIHDNHIHDSANWDDGVGGGNHHDYIHIWDHQAGTYVSNIQIYNNQFDGNFGLTTTAFVYLEDAIENATLYNNVGISNSPTGKTAYWFAAPGVGNGGSNQNGLNNAAYNNFAVTGNGSAQVSGVAVYAGYQTNFTAINNIASGGQADISMQESTIASGSSLGVASNLYDDLFADYGDSNTFGRNALTYSAVPVWQAACNCDANSKAYSWVNLKLNSSGVPQAGSPAIGAGQNLSNLCNGNLSALCSDKNGNPRPTSGPWDVGAYASGTNSNQPAAPTDVEATVSSN